MEKQNNRTIFSKENALFFLLLVGGFIFYLQGITHENLWYDESYTAALLKHSWGEIIRITGADCHPPLYYLLLKAAILIFGESVFLLRVFSAIGVIGLAALGLGPVRRITDNRTGLFYTLLVIITPTVLYMGQEARMYTWSALFVTGSALYGYLASCQGKKGDWIKFCIFSIAAAYTHYYALLAVGIINFLLLIFTLIKNRDKTKKVLICLAIQVLSYLPWTLILVDQINTVSANFWIGPFSRDEFWKILLYPLWIKEKPVYFVIILFIVFSLVYALYKKIKSAWLILLSFAVYLLTIAAGIAATYLIRPVLIDRYTFPVIGLLMLAVAFAIAQVKIKTLRGILLAAVVVISIPQILHINQDRLKGPPMFEVGDYLKSSVKDGDVFLHNYSHTFGTFNYYYPNNRQFLYYNPASGDISNNAAFLPNGSTLSDLDQFFKEHQTAWVVLSKWTTDVDILQPWLSSGKLVIVETMREFGLEQMWPVIQVFKVQVKPD